MRIRTPKSRALATALSALLCAGVVAAQDRAPSATLKEAQQQQEGRLMAIELAIPRCLSLHPDEGKDIQAAWADYSTAHATEVQQYHADQAANPKEFAYAKEKINQVLEPSVSGTQGAQICSNVAKLVRSLGGPLDPAMAAGMYYQSILRADALTEACGRLHPAIADDLARDRAKWEADDAAIQKLSRDHMAEMAKIEGSAVPGMIADSKRVWTTMVQEQEAKGTAEAYCRAAFSELAAGKMHQTNPDVYEALNRALDAGANADAGADTDAKK